MVILEDVFKKDLSDPEKVINAVALNFPCNPYSTGDAHREGKLHPFLLFSLPSNKILSSGDPIAIRTQLLDQHGNQSNSLVKVGYLGGCKEFGAQTLSE